jgi:hypothetical protein
MWYAMVDLSYYLQPLTTWLFVWQYFDAVTSLIHKKLPLWARIALMLVYLCGSLSLVAVYAALVLLEGR